jgi:hypothetical protein
MEEDEDDDDDDFKFRFLRCSQNQHITFPSLKCNNNGPTYLSGEAVKICH